MLSSFGRKYRPTNFGQLVGQNGMVRTLENAMASGRIAHAYAYWSAWNQNNQRE